LLTDAQSALGLWEKALTTTAAKGMRTITLM